MIKVKPNSPKSKPVALKSGKPALKVNPEFADGDPKPKQKDDYNAYMRWYRRQGKAAKDAGL